MQTRRMTNERGVATELNLPRAGIACAVLFRSAVFKIKDTELNKDSAFHRSQFNVVF